MALDVMTAIAMAAGHRFAVVADPDQLWQGDRQRTYTVMGSTTVPWRAGRRSRSSSSRRSVRRERHGSRETLVTYRLAIISDVHGDLQALQDALKEIARIGCEAIICAGDLVELRSLP